MKIVLLADNRKNELLVNFCTAYKHILQRHELFSAYNLSRLISSNTELNVKGFSADVGSSFEQFASMVNFNEIDAVLYLRDTEFTNSEVSLSLLRACDINQIPYATNLATAEILVLAIERGDLDWRELVR